MNGEDASAADARSIALAVDTTSPAIDARGVEKVYGASVALAGADLVAFPGEIHGLLGENGAGKSTLVRILAGIERADAGEIKLFGEDISDADEAGCAFIHQDLALFPTMSVAANIALTGGFERRFGLIDDDATIRAAEELLDRLEMSINPRAMVGELPLAAQTVVAIARALSHGVRLVVLDEPTAYLEAEQVRDVLRLLGRLREQGVACLLITHRADDVLAVCDRITVLRDGETVAAGESTERLTELDLVQIISGHAPQAKSTRGAAVRRNRDEEVLSLDAAVGEGFGPVTLGVAPGEIVGVCGLADAGAFEVGKVVFGLSPLESGEVLIEGKAVGFRSPAEAIEARVAYVPSERRAAGIADTLSARENIFMRGGRWYAPIRANQERARGRELMKRLGVVPARPEQVVASFSGGNQQKIILAKWLDQNPRLLILNDPTAGVDLAAKGDIHARVKQLCEERSLGVLLISSDFSEVAEFADRIYVMRRKLVVGEVRGSEATPQQLVALAYGGVDR